MVSRRARDFKRFLLSVESFTAGQVQVVNYDDETMAWVDIQVSPNEGFYHGATLKFHIYLPKSFPRHAPTITCQTQVFHPNIDPDSDDGNVCLNLLDEWESRFGMEDCIQGILFLLYEPNEEDPLSPYFSGLSMDPDKMHRSVRVSLTGRIVEGFSGPRLIEDDEEILDILKEIELEDEKERLQQEAEEAKAETEVQMAAAADVQLDVDLREKMALVLEQLVLVVGAAPVTSGSADASCIEAASTKPADTSNASLEVSDSPTISTEVNDSAGTSAAATETCSPSPQAGSASMKVSETFVEVIETPAASVEVTSASSEVSESHAASTEFTGTPIMCSVDTEEGPTSREVAEPLATCTDLVGIPLSSTRPTTIPSTFSEAEPSATCTEIASTSMDAAKSSADTSFELVNTSSTSTEVTGTLSTCMGAAVAPVTFTEVSSTTAELAVAPATSRAVALIPATTTGEDNLHPDTFPKITPPAAEDTEVPTTSSEISATRASTTEVNSTSQEATENCASKEVLATNANVTETPDTAEKKMNMSTMLSRMDALIAMNEDGDDEDDDDYDDDDYDDVDDDESQTDEEELECREEGPLIADPGEQNLNALNIADSAGAQASSVGAYFSRQTSKLERIVFGCSNCVFEDKGIQTVEPWRVNLGTYLAQVKTCAFVAPDYDSVLLYFGIMCMYVLHRILR